MSLNGGSAAPGTRVTNGATVTVTSGGQPEELGTRATQILGDKGARDDEREPLLSRTLLKPMSLYGRVAGPDRISNTL